MTSIATNRAAIRVQYHGDKNINNENKAYARLASGTRITDASDDAAGLFVANRMKVQILGIERAVKNSFDGISLVSTAEANLNEIRNMVLRDARDSSPNGQRRLCRQSRQEFRTD